MTDMQFCKAQLRAAKAKTDLIGNLFSIGPAGILPLLELQTISHNARGADCGSWLAGSLLSS